MPSRQGDNSAGQDPKRTENPRTTRMRDAVLRAVVELMMTEGAGAVTALRVSKRANVARSTIYDHWPTSDSLVLAAIDKVTAPRGPVTLTDDLSADLLWMLNGLRERLERRPFRIWFATLLDHGNRDEAFAAAQERLVTATLRPVSDIVAAAQDRGELTEVIDAADAALQLAAPILTHHVLLRSAATDEQINETITQFLASHATKTEATEQLD